MSFILVSTSVKALMDEPLKRKNLFNGKNKNISTQPSRSGLFFENEIKIMFENRKIEFLKF